MTSFEISADVAVRLFAAVLFGGIVGFEREASGQPAGLRTHIAVSLGAGLFGVISTLGFLEFEGTRATTNIQIDVTRVASQVVVGLGFLGAGVIITRRGTVENLTTAASIWTMSAVGLAAGVGDIGSAALATVITVGVLTILRPMRAWIGRAFARPEARIRIGSPTPIDIPSLLASLPSDVEAKVKGVQKKDDRTFVVVTLHGPPGGDLSVALATLAHRPDVTELEPA